MKPPVFGQQKRQEDRRQSEQAKRARKAIYNSAAWKAQRLRVFQRDDYICQVCHRPVGILPDDSPHCDHIMAMTEAVHVRDDELRTTCRECHSAKTASTDGGFGNG